MINSALMRGVPTVEHYDLDTTLTRIIDEVIPKALETVGRIGRLAESDERLLERAVEAIGRQKEEGSTEHETVS
jgi:hypothetical protein